jgi:urease alpha subunit
MPTPRDMLSSEPITSPPRKKSRTTFKSLVVDSEEDDERIYSDEIRGGGGKEFDAITTQGNIKEEPEPNLDQVIDNIQVEPVVYVELIISIIEPTIVAIKSFQHVQPVVELVQMENP